MKEVPLSSLSLTQCRVPKPLSFQLNGIRGVGEQKAFVLAAGQERGGGGLHLPHLRGLIHLCPSHWAGLDINGLPASVLPLHHKHPLS